MRRTVFTCFVALGFVVAVSAQDPARPASPAAPGGLSAPQNPDRPQGTAGQADDKAIMVVGCVAGGPSDFTLTNAMAAGSTDKPAKPGAVGTAGIATSYDLTPRAGVDLKPHVGHKVEITGTPDMAKSTSPSTGAAAGKPAMAKLTVTNLKMVSASCP
jgi:hypothetical protein